MKRKRFTEAQIIGVLSLLRRMWERFRPFGIFFTLPNPVTSKTHRHFQYYE